MSEWISPVVDIQSGQYSSRPSRNVQSTTRYECDSGFEKKCGNSWTGTIIVIIVAIILIVMFALIIFYVTRKTEPLFVPINPPNNSNPTEDTTGESDDGRTFVNNGEFYTDSPACNAGRTRRWSQDPNSPNLSCQCVVPFYAPKCDLESFIDTYYAVGNIGEDTLTTSIISQSTVDRLSFPQENPEYKQDGQTMCTNICDGIEDCIGVIYKQADAPNYGIGEGPSSECTLISDMYVNPGNNITYDDMMQADLYLKDGETVKYKDRVFVYMGTLPLRYWLSDRNSDSGGSSWALYHKILYQLPFMPANIINNTGTREEEAWVGVFSNQPIPVCDLKEIIEGGTTDKYVVVDSSATEVDLPQGWVNPYVIFVSPSDPDGAKPCECPDSEIGFKWNEGFSDCNGKKITISPGTSVSFVSDDGYEHDMYETDCDWNPVSLIQEATTEFSLALTFRKTTYLRCNVHPDTMRLKVEVESEKNEVSVPWNYDPHSSIEETMYEASLGQCVRFVSTDDLYHGLITKNSPESITTKISKPMTYKFYPKKKGKYHFACRIYGAKISVCINVK